MSEPKDLVIFRRWKNYPQTVIAIFPLVPSGRDGYHCEMYERVGQHGGGDDRGVVSQTVPAHSSDADVKALFKELSGRGYNLKVGEKIPRNALDIRRAIVKAMK